MAVRQKRVCVPMEMELLPLYREPRGSARIRREQRRENRRDKRRQQRTHIARGLRHLAASARTLARAAGRLG